MGMPRTVRADHYLWAVPYMDKQRNMVATGYRPAREIFPSDNV
jgi:hypothetical protein